MKRFKLNKYVAGVGMKEIHGSILSGSITPNTFVKSDMYILGLKGVILTNPIISADSTIYNIGLFEREYSVNNPDIYSNGSDLEVRATDADIIDTIQFGDFCFNLSNNTSEGTRYTLAENTSSYYTEPHEVVTYTPGTSGDSIDLIINKINFNITDENLVYGLISGDNIILYVKDNTNYEVYSIPNRPGSLPFNYLLEQPLLYNSKFAREGLVYGVLSGITGIAYTPFNSSNILYSPYADDVQENIIYMNPFRLKNMYNNNWQIEINRSDNSLSGMRNYTACGNTQNTIWLSYNYVREQYNVLQLYELVERIRGLYKYKGFEGHKSNIYSIRINNSGLNQSMTNDTVKTKLREIIEQTVLNVVKKIAPAHTQLLDIQYTGL